MDNSAVRAPTKILSRIGQRIRHGRPTATSTSRPAPRTPLGQQPVERARPDPPDGLRHLVFVVFDSLRYDSAMEAGMPNMARLGQIEERWSYASWTAPSHYNMLMGLLPHTSPSGVYASDYYQQDFLRYQDRLGLDDMSFKRMLPSLFLPEFLRGELGYDTRAVVSLPVLNPSTPINVQFDRFQLADRHNDMAAVLDEVCFDGDRPTFHLLNIGETHYPYATADEDPAEWPRISGVHGVFKHLDEAVAGNRVDQGPAFFDDTDMKRLRGRQIDAARAVDGLLERLYDEAPAGTWFVITADHGELFGEDGYFGHGPVQHEKVYQVPFVEGMIR